MDEVLRALETGCHLDDPLSQAVAQQHPALRPVAMEQPDRGRGSLLVTGCGDGCPYRYVIRMARETVRPECDHYIGMELAQHPGRQLDQNPTLDVCQLAVWVVKTSGLGEPQMLTRSVQLALPGCCQRRPGRRASVPDLAGSPLGQTHDPHVSPSTRVLGQGPARAESFVVRVREDAQYTRRTLAGTAPCDVVPHRVQLIAPLPAAMASTICPKSYFTVGKRLSCVR